MTETELREHVVAGHGAALESFTTQGESPIETLMLWGLLAQYPGAARVKVVASAEPWCADPSFPHEWWVTDEPLGPARGLAILGACDCCRVEVLPQMKLRTEGGIYRLDMAIRFAHAEGPATPTWVDLECDGHDFHERTKEQAERDKERDRNIQAAGWEVARFTGSEITRDPVAAAVKALDFCKAAHIRRRRVA
jgi:hypothetical protein